MASFEVHNGGAPDGDELVTVQLRRSELEWITTATESEMARHGRQVAKDPLFHTGVLKHLAGGYERLRAVT